MGNIDVVYVLGTGSGWKNNELRFSLRSIEKNAVNIGNIFIVGEKPDFLSKDVIHIKALDIFNPNVNADGNIITKVLAACADERLSEDFLFINDDHLILKPVDLSQVPAFHKGDMNTYKADYWLTNNYWRSSRLKKTMETLNEKGLTAYHFDCHTPILFNKKLFPQVIARFDYQLDCGLTMKSLYGNSIYSESGKLLEGEKKKVFKHMTTDQLNKHLYDCGYMSFNDFGLNNSLKIWLYNQFPNRSKWETSDAEDKHIQISNWLASDRNFDEGVRIFERYMHGVNLIRLFRGGETVSLRKKLEYKLINALTDL
jgi:hypothetical protein